MADITEELRSSRLKRSLAAAALTIASCSTEPVEPASGPELTLSPPSIVIGVGDGATLTASVHNSTEQAVYVSRNRDVAVVDAGGEITGVGVGSTHVVATLATRGDVRDSVVVHVLAASVDTCVVARPEFGGPATAADRALFAYDVEAPLNLQMVVTSSGDGVEINDISYTSPGGGVVPGILAVPLGRAGLRPGLVILHPSGLNAKSMTNYSRMMAQHGTVVIAIDAPYWRRGGPPIRFLPEDRAEQIQLIMDLQRAVDVLRARDDVDPARIGFEGYSYGGILGAQLVGVEKRLRAAVLAAAHGGHVTGATAPTTIGVLINMSCDRRNTWLRNMVPIEPIRFIPHSSPTALLFQIAKFDTAVLPADAEALARAAGSPKDIRYYDSGHSLNPQAMVERHDWWTAQLGVDSRRY